MTATLVSIAYSPWSLRAKMALDLQGAPYQLRGYTSMLGEPRLRWELRSFRGVVSVPVLLRDDGPPLRDSFEIAAWGAERSERPLITPANQAECLRWNGIANGMMEAGRVRTTRATLADPAALLELVPPPLNAIRPLGLAVGRFGARRLLGRYGFEVDDAAVRERIVAGLDAMREALARGPWLLGELSYADLTMAASLQFVSPHATTKLTPNARAHWEDPELAASYADLLAWRDGLFERWKAARTDVRSR